MRPVRPTDRVAAHIAAIYAEHGLIFDLAFEEDLEDVSASYHHGAFWVAEVDGRLVGTGAVVPHGGARLIKRIYIAAEGRRQGLARRLLRMALGWGDFEWTELWSDVRFRSAHALYRSEGFSAGPCRILTDPDRSVERYFSRRG